jgi:hypothetical protein
MAEALTPETCRAVVQDIIELAREKYVYPNVGKDIANFIQARFDQGAYDGLVDASELALSLTIDLREVSGDQHWSVVYDPQQATAHVDPETEDDEVKLARWLVDARRRNFGFEKVERLKGNVGYIDLREFALSEYAGETAVSAMNFVAHCDALIFDLRQNHGGYPSMVQLVTSYLLDPEPQHINTFYYRPSDEIQQFWTFPHVPGKRLPHVPVYVLTSNATGSAPEEFTYNLKHMGRATIVGETTVGAAHPVTREIVQEHFVVRLPYGRPINPITKKNWEGTGVEPHIAVPQEEALKTAHLHALEQIGKQCTDEQHKRDLEWELEIVRSLYEPLAMAETTLSRYAGQYGKRSFVVEGGALTYTHQEIPVAWKLAPMSETRFRLDEDVKFEFILDEQGAATAVVISYRDGRPQITVDKTA